jgi:hypothetical protein
MEIIKIKEKIYYKIIKFKNRNFRTPLQICYRLVQNQVIKLKKYKVIWY